MDEKQKFEDNKIHNAPFLRAFDLLSEEKKIGKGALAKLMGGTGGYISDFRSGKKRVGTDYMDRLCNAYEGRLNRRYLEGKSKYLLLANVPPEELRECTEREKNPDYDAIKENASQYSQSVVSGAPSSIDTSFLIEKAVGKATAYADRAISALESQLADKEAMITVLNARIRDLEYIIRHKGYDRPSDPPFIGTAEP